MTGFQENTPKSLQDDEAMQKIDGEVLDAIRRVRKALETISGISGECLDGTTEEEGADWPRLQEKLFLLHATVEDLMLNTQSLMAMGYVLNLIESKNKNEEDDCK